MGRWFLAAAPINTNEIAIMGGMGLVDDEMSCLGDVHILNTQTGQFEQRIQNFNGLLQFQCTGNKAICVDDETVLALVESDDYDNP